ncbi:GNAT family N-acetyltransferase [Idiomarina tyrosinivorans]|uniref:GNAT family N-acetyltransferase n=1 Tax=Idiomarina tyrosinivorans TaxID=1445662 RepID=A0A432ZQZ9_9GAMM|nr:GNAT family N-acetyltransferase [Idiomarina tyrosinivorans]RUO80355.1 GNAT family N-acetyltransferase [Idiomarina tyrosinivorans]
MSEVIYRPITAADSAAVIALGNQVHGDNYLTEESLADYLQRGQQQGVNLCWLAEVEGEVAGIRLTFAPGQWQIDNFCTPEEWNIPLAKICYFKCAAVAEHRRGLGIGKTLLMNSIDGAKALGCEAGLAHIWMQSPKNSAYEYFTKCGGELIQEHDKRWYKASIEDGYYCPVCDGVCFCTAGEMLLTF